MAANFQYFLGHRFASVLSVHLAGQCAVAAQPDQAKARSRDWNHLTPWVAISELIPYIALKRSQGGGIAPHLTLLRS